ncbi:MAG: acetolactate synthase large subunit, partial [Muribaculaceae bacterium]|nr:acetolactate synthase large subunit [Muribaculaceae bacterium]
VVLFVGDGGLQMTIQEFGTIMQYGVNVKIVLLNNNFLGNVRQWQAMFFDNRFSQTPMLNPDFIAIAAAYGIAGENVAGRGELDDAIGRMAQHPGSYIINVNIDATDMIFPMIAPGKAVDEILLTQHTTFTL